VIRRRAGAVLTAAYAVLFAVGCGGGYGDTCDTDAECNDGLECLKNCADDGFGNCVCSDVSVCTMRCGSDDDCVDNGAGTMCTSCSGHSNCTK
jgi:hypothetical protein